MREAGRNKRAETEKEKKVEEAREKDGPKNKSEDCRKVDSKERWDARRIQQKGEEG